MQYKINIEAKIDSTLPRQKLENQLVIALHNTDTGYSKLDGVDTELEVVEYIDTKADAINNE